MKLGALRIRGLLAIAGAAVCVGLTPAAVADVIISEIMYNPDSDESQPNDVEWIELYNNGDSAVDISGWYIQDEDGATDGIRPPAIIAPGEAVVLVPHPMTQDIFYSAWGDGYQVFIITNWAYPADFQGLSNSPAPDNEILKLRDAAGSVMDEVNYDDADPWPRDDPDGPSICLYPDKHDAISNDDGANWRLSADGVAGGRIVIPGFEFTGFDVGSPGVVEATAGCYADCDGTGALDFFDFLCFQNEFSTGSAYADCDGSGGADFFDFLCFQNEFAAGCP
ncbi:MAG: lamin tail domain-containing protein [Phycisphaerales bacterium JB039]